MNCFILCLSFCFLFGYRVSRTGSARQPRDKAQYVYRVWVRTYLPRMEHVLVHSLTIQLGPGAPVQKTGIVSIHGIPRGFTQPNACMSPFVQPETRDHTAEIGFLVKPANSTNERARYLRRTGGSSQIRSRSAIPVSPPLLLLLLLITAPTQPPPRP